MKPTQKIIAIIICFAMFVACESVDIAVDGNSTATDLVSSDATSHAVSTVIGDGSYILSDGTYSSYQSMLESYASSGSQSWVTSSQYTPSQGGATVEPPISIVPNPDPTDGKIRYSGTRDPFYWPFSETSIWNMPIGSDAILQKANFGDAYSIGVDDEYIIKVPAGSPIVDVYSPSSWSQRWPRARKIGTIQIPADF